MTIAVALYRILLKEDYSEFISAIAKIKGKK